jgi:hypothetical protein
MLVTTGGGTYVNALCDVGVEVPHGVVTVKSFNPAVFAGTSATIVVGDETLKFCDNTPPKATSVAPVK